MPTPKSWLPEVVAGVEHLAAHPEDHRSISGAGLLSALGLAFAFYGDVS